jgi:carbamoyl-phosphate synthase large subunit
VLREIGVETGGSNVQFAVNPKDGRLIVIEMNPRVSRSSALASKATGFPIAKVAAKLAVGYTLDEITNDITGATPASFEPTIDYVVTKIPRFAFEKFKGAEPLLGTAMKSVGEVMAIGRNFHESLQKALRGLETGLTGFNIVDPLVGAPKDEIIAALAQPTPDRLLVAAQAFARAVRRGDPRGSEVRSVVPARIKEIVDAEKRSAGKRPAAGCRRAARLKAMGFSDKRPRAAIGASPRGPRAKGHGLLHDAVKAMTGAPPSPKCARCATSSACGRCSSGSTPARPSSRRRRPICIRPMKRRASASRNARVRRPTDRKKVVILGGGPNRIGQGIEFDYCCCHACFALARRLRDDHGQLQPGDGVDRL